MATVLPISALQSSTERAHDGHYGMQRMSLHQKSPVTLIHPRCSLTAAFCLALISACTDSAAPAKLPAKPGWQTMSGSCSWHWREGGGLGLWAEVCELPTGLWQVVWEPREQAFVIKRDAEQLDIVVQPWRLEPQQDISSLSELLVRAGHLQADAECRWQVVDIRRTPATARFFQLTPLADNAFAITEQGEIPEPKCGRYGASTHGVRYFITDTRWPGFAVFVDEGQERPMFDPASITLESD